MIAFMLHYACQESFDLFFVGLEVLVDPAQTDMLGAFHLFRQSRQAEASLGASLRVVAENLDLRIDQSQFASGAFRK